MPPNERPERRTSQSPLSSRGDPHHVSYSSVTRKLQSKASERVEAQQTSSAVEWFKTKAPDALNELNADIPSPETSSLDPSPAINALKELLGGADVLRNDPKAPEPTPKASKRPSTTKKRHVAKPEGKPILSDDFSGYKQHYLKSLGANNEPVVYAYAGCDDRAVGRRWLFSPPALKAFEVYVAAGNSPLFPKAMFAYSRECDEWEEEKRTLEWAVKEWPVDVLPDKVQAATKSKPNSESMLAFLLYWLPTQSDRYCELTLEDQEKEYTTFKQTYPYSLPAWDAISSVKLVSPVWNHPGDKIAMAEKCCRAFALLHWSRIAKVTSGEERKSFEDKFNMHWSREHVLESRSIEATSKPIWMREILGSTDDVHPKAKPPSPSEVSPRRIVFCQPTLAQHAIQLKISRRDEKEFADLETDRNRHEKDIRLPHECRSDPRDFKYEEVWRDHIRLYLKLKDARASITSLALAVVDADGDSRLKTFYSRNSGTHLRWDQFLDRVEAATEEEEVNVYLSVEYKGEFFRGEMEWTGSLDQLELKPGPKNCTNSANDTILTISLIRKRLSSQFQNAEDMTTSIKRARTDVASPLDIQTPEDSKMPA